MECICYVAAHNIFYKTFWSPGNRPLVQFSNEEIWFEYMKHSTVFFQIITSNVASRATIMGHVTWALFFFLLIEPRLRQCLSAFSARQVFLTASKSPWKSCQSVQVTQNWCSSLGLFWMIQAVWQLCQGHLDPYYKLLLMDWHPYCLRCPHI